MCEQQRVQNLSREAPKCCAWQHQGGGPETRSGTVQSLKCCPCQQKRAEAPKCCAWQHQGGGGPNQVLRLAASREGGGPETRSGTVQSLKCCPCQQKRAARLPSAAPSSINSRAPKRARVPSRACRAAPASRNEPRGSQVLRLAASRQGAPKRARVPSRA